MDDIESIITDALNITIYSIGEYSDNDLVKSVAGRVGHIVLAQSDINNLTTDLSAINSEVDGKAEAVHTHDDRYYTEAEVTAFLASKSDTSHLHDERYFTEAEITAFLADKAAAVHNHDERYYTESEVTSLLAGKSSVGHAHGISDVTSLQAILDNKGSKQFALYANNLTFNFFGYRVGFSTISADATFNVTNLPSYEICYIYAYNSSAASKTLTMQSGYIYTTGGGNAYVLSAGNYVTFMLYTDGTNKYITKIG